MSAVDISEFPQRLADALNITLFAGRILASCIIMLIFLFPILLIMRKNQALALTIFGFGVLGFLVAVGWLPVWNFVIIILIIGLLFSNAIVKQVRGSG